MKIAYAKLARSFPTARSAVSNVGGDIEVVNLLHHLLDEGHEVHLIGQTQRKVECDHPRAEELLVNHWGYDYDATYNRDQFRAMVEPLTRQYDDTFWAYEAWLDACASRLPDNFDEVIVWLGHHGTSLHPLPPLRKKVQSDTGRTTVQQNDLRYSYPIVHAINRHKWQPLYICPDPRNRMKFRDFSHRMLRKVAAQFDEGKEFKGYDPDAYAGAGQVFTMKSYYRYEGVETLAIDHSLPDNIDTDTRLENPPISPLGLIVNEGYPYVSKDKRLRLVQEWCEPWLQDPGFAIHGTWSMKSASELFAAMHKVYAPEIAPVNFDQVIETLQDWRATFTMPATNTGWATAKPWESFVAGIVCFRHPRYDRQNHIYSASKMPGDLATFLSPLSPAVLEKRVDEMLLDDNAWRLRIGQQYEFLRENYDRGRQAILARLGKVDQ